MTRSNDCSVIADYEVSIERLFQLEERRFAQVLEHPGPALPGEIANLGSAMTTILSVGHQGIDGLMRNRALLHAGFGVVRKHLIVLSLGDDLCLNHWGDRNCHGDPLCHLPRRWISCVSR